MPNTLCIKFMVSNEIYMMNFEFFILNVLLCFTIILIAQKSEYLVCYCWIAFWNTSHGMESYSLGCKDSYYESYLDYRFDLEDLFCYFWMFFCANKTTVVHS